MITIFLKKNKTFSHNSDHCYSQDDYDWMIEHVPIHRLSCTCGHKSSLVKHGYYKRFIKFNMTTEKIKVLRIKCKSCGKTHAILPEWVVPYSQIPLEDHLNIIKAHLSAGSFKGIMQAKPSIQEAGFEGLLPQRRSDTGRSRKLDEDMMEQIKHLKQQYPRLPATLVHQHLFENGTINRKGISLSTVTRYINQLKLENKLATNSEMRRYERAHINEVWYGDSSTGLYLKKQGNKKKVWIIAVIDDASRMITGIDVFFNDNYLNVMSGVPCTLPTKPTLRQFLEAIF